MTSILRCAVAVFVTMVVAGCSTANQEASFCEASAELQKVDALSAEVSPSDDAATRGALTQTAAQAARVAKEAPQEILREAEVVAAFLLALTNAVSNTSSDDPLERSAAIGAARQEFDDELSESVEKLSAFVARTCSPAP
ncbi:MAG: hypothetical protein ACJZ57_02165 [Candidatus Poriferisodalaceae bacterium]|nr:MAG: hypothetical protein CNE88_04705 [Acidimicrobiales bacterium MED-G01]